jgi:nitroimidazol reductase NimA-like FMN-containing flavoprotein (pyridoxamine 5'-phosphate oxidase superfamily)
MVVEIVLECKDHSFMCNLSSEIAQFLLNTPLLYSCTVNEYNLPYIRPIMYSYEMDKCRFLFLSEINSQEAKNLQRNRNISFTTETNHPTNPFANSGIMIQGKTTLSSSEEDRTYVKRSLLRKYSSHLMPEIVDFYSTETDVVVSAKIHKISYWRGPKFEQFVCKARERAK